MPQLDAVGVVSTCSKMIIRLRQIGRDATYGHFWCIANH
jgi:hypothetical protein